MDWVIVFLALFAGVGILQLLDSYKLWGPFSEYISIDLSISLIEFFWIIACIVVLIWLPLTSLEQSLPISYIAFHVLVGLFSGKAALQSESIEDVVRSIPVPVLVASTFVGLLFCGFSVYLLLAHQPINPDLSFLEFILLNKWKVLGFVALCGLALAAYVAFKNKGMKEFIAQIKSAIEENNDCQKVFGEVISVTLNSEVTQDAQEDVYAFNVVGKKVTGILVAEIRSVSSDNEEIIAGEIYLEDGEVVEVGNRKLRA